MTKDLNTVDTSSTYVLICIFATWMHLMGGVSRATTTKILKFIDFFILYRAGYSLSGLY